MFLWELSSWSLGCSYKVPGSCLHLHPLERVAFSGSSVCQDVPCPPVDTVGHPTVAPTVIPSIEVSCQACIKPPACTIVLTTVSSCITVVVSVCCAEGSAIMVITFAVAQCIACITRVLPRCQTIPGGKRKCNGRCLLHCQSSPIKLQPRWSTFWELKVQYVRI